MLVESVVECNALISPALHARTHVAVALQSSHHITLDESEVVADAVVNFIHTAGDRSTAAGRSCTVNAVFGTARESVDTVASTLMLAFY